MMIKKVQKYPLHIKKDFIQLTFWLVFLAIQLSFSLYAYQERDSVPDRPLLPVDGKVVTETGHAYVFPDTDTVIIFNRVRLEIPAGAVNRPVKISIEKLEQIDKLSSGICNVTGDAIGYHFQTDGMEFSKAVKITIPYDKSNIKEQGELDHLYTYFYNTQNGLWKQLERIAVNEKEGQLISFTTHLTDVINGVMKPDISTPLGLESNNTQNINMDHADNGINLTEASQDRQNSSNGLSYQDEPVFVVSGNWLTLVRFLRKLNSNPQKIQKILAKKIGNQQRYCLEFDNKGKEIKFKDIEVSGNFRFSIEFTKSEQEKNKDFLYSRIIFDENAIIQPTPSKKVSSLNFIFIKYNEKKRTWKGSAHFYDQEEYNIGKD
jgi:hypothetical protein